MRFSAVQEDGYGVGLGQETPPNDVDESMMAATGDLEPGGGSAVEEGSMISNLPLLFASGYPTSLEKITLVCVMLLSKIGHKLAGQSIKQKLKRKIGIMKVLLYITAGAGAVHYIHGSVFTGT